jgi:hypothetical protein
VRGARGWIVAGVIAVAIAAAAYALRPHNDSPEHSSNSDASNGTSAVLLFAQAMGHPTAQVEGTFAPPAANSVMFVFTPTSQYTADEADALYDWVRSRGGVLVYASESGDPELDRAFGISRAGVSSGGPYDASPALDGAKTVAGGSFIEPLDPSPAQVTILRSAGDGGVAGYSQRIGLGRVVVIADPLVVCNGYLEKADNGALLADLLGSTPGTPVSVDEYHHGLTVSDFAPQAWVRTPWGAALIWLIVAVFAGLWLRGRRFGPLVERPAQVARSDAEWSVAVGQLLRRSSARGATLGLLAAATERAVATQTGLSVQPREGFWNALWVRAPQTASRLAEVEGWLRRPNLSEHDVLEGARKLHDIAHPHPPARR